MNVNELDVFFPEVGDYYRAVCLYNGVVYELCPNNHDSLCTTKYILRPERLYHPWDGKNALKCLCG